MSVVEHSAFDYPGLITLIYRCLTTRRLPFWYIVQTPYVLLNLLAGYVTEDTQIIVYFWITMGIAMWKVCELLFGLPLCLIVILLLQLCGIELSLYLSHLLLALSTLFGTGAIIFLAINKK